MAQLGIQIRPANTTWPDLREVALLAEEVGFDSIYTWDHLLPVADIDPALPNFEGWQLLAAWRHADDARPRGHARDRDTLCATRGSWPRWR